MGKDVGLDVGALVVSAVGLDVGALVGLAVGKDTGGYVLVGGDTGFFVGELVGETRRCSRFGAGRSSRC